MVSIQLDIILVNNHSVILIIVQYTYKVCTSQKRQTKTRQTRERLKHTYPHVQLNPENI